MHMEVVVVPDEELRHDVNAFPVGAVVRTLVVMDGQPVGAVGTVCPSRGKYIRVKFPDERSRSGIGTPFVSYELELLPPPSEEDMAYVRRSLGVEV